MAAIIDIDFADPQRRPVQTVKNALDHGGVIGFPTDTFYGLGADPFNITAVAEIFRIKNRSAQKPILVLIADIEQLPELVEAEEISPTAKKLMAGLWPGPLTLLFKARAGLPAELTAGSGKIGVRLPAHPFTRELIRHIGRPLTATSANLSGGPAARTAQEVERLFGAHLALIVDGGPATAQTASTVLDTTVTPPRLMREGALTLERIRAVLDAE
jgi:L-threonylcarbamoyladenylate synthase